MKLNNLAGLVHLETVSLTMMESGGAGEENKRSMMMTINDKDEDKS